MDKSFGRLAMKCQFYQSTFSSANVLCYVPYSGLISKGKNFKVFVDLALSSKF